MCMMNLFRKNAHSILCISQFLLVLSALHLNSVGAQKDSEDFNVKATLRLPAYYHSNASYLQTDIVERKTVNGLNCHFPIRIGEEGERELNDCLRWWDGQDWCMTEDHQWHVCVPRWASQDFQIGYRSPANLIMDSARITGTTVGSLINRLISGSDLNEDIDMDSIDNSTNTNTTESKQIEIPKVSIAPPIMKGPILISEFMASNKNTFEDQDGSHPDWIEIQNDSPDDIDLEGWHMTDDKEMPDKWTFPDVTLKAQQYLLVIASGEDKMYRRTDGRPVVHTNFKLSNKGGYLSISTPKGEISSAFTSYPPQYSDVSYGKAGSKLSVFIRNNYNKENEREYGYLQNPTPNTRNSFLRLMGPAVFDVTENPKERPKYGEDFTIYATVYSQAEEETHSVTLHLRTNFLQEWMLVMRPNGETTDSGGIVYTASIGGDTLKPGDMLRWYVSATASNDQVTRVPQVNAMDGPQYFGTVVQATSEGLNGLPVMHLFSANANAATSEKGGRGAIFYKDRLYDNVAVRRRGQTTMRWKKPKLKVDFKGKVFKFADDEKKVEEFNLQSHFYELGSPSYMREGIAAQVLTEAGVPTPIVFPLDFWVNGQFYGLYSFVEQIDDQFLERNDYPTSGPLYKAWHIWKSNLRYDIPAEDMQWAYRKGNLKDVKIPDNILGSYHDLENFTKGLVGKGNTPDSWSRTNYVMTHIDLPEVVNELAAQNMIVNQDRLTKNYYVYFNPDTEEWLRFPWDLEAAFGISGKLGGEPSQFYCVLACEQFNSPLFGDSEHPQDIRDFYDGGRWQKRKLLFFWAPPLAYNPYSARRNKEPEFTCENPGKDGTACFNNKSPRYADGTFNYLYDAILDVDFTRQMYLRRLRTLMDEFLNGRLEQIVTDHYKKIRRAAKMDNMKWQIGDIDEGYEQLLTEQLPRRREQLYETYGPTGSRLIPGEQKAKPNVVFGNLKYPNSELDETETIEIKNLEKTAVDISAWEIDQDVKFSFKPGTVIPAEASLYVCKNVLACKMIGRTTTPRFVQGPYRNSLPLSISRAAKPSVQLNLLDANGQIVDKL